MLPRESVRALSDFVRKAAQADRADVSVERALPGDAGRAHYLISAELHGGPSSGRHALVVRGRREDGVSGLASAEEFAIRQVAFRTGLTTPEPLWLEPDGHVLAWPFMVLRHAPGTAAATILQRDLTVEEGDRLAFRLGQELARLHQITLEDAPLEIGFLPRPAVDWAQQRAARWRAALDGVAAPQPCFEWAINWFLDHAPKIEGFALCHRDLRLGNLVVDGGQLVGILDLEHVGWSDPMEDLGWLCARGGRQGLPDREAGGIGSREAFYAGYESGTGKPVDDARVRYWEAVAPIRWAIIALQQGERHASGREPSLDLALTGLRAIECDYDLLAELPKLKKGA